MARKKKEIPLFKEKRRRGRPIQYDFSLFKKASTKFLVFEGIGLKEYDSIRSTFARWRRRHGVEGRFEYDIVPATDMFPPYIAIWRQKPRTQDVVRERLRKVMEEDEAVHTCGCCGYIMAIVRPGKYECRNPSCEENGL